MERSPIRPARALRPGDRIRLVAPASPFDQRAFDRGVQTLVAMGFVPVWYHDEFAATGYLAGSDQARAERLAAAFEDDTCQAIWCIRGGYGSARLLDRLPWSAMRRSGKPFIGFSDVTALLLQLSRPRGLVSVHGPVITQLGLVPPSVRRWLVQLLTGLQAAGRAPLGALKQVRAGRGEGILLGGNLSLLASLVGTPHMPQLSGAILFIEDVGEQAYRLDRLFLQLVQSGALRGVRGVLLGSLKDCKPEGKSRYSARSVLEQAAAGLGVPVLSGADVGHQHRNVALPLGVPAVLDADARSLTLTAPAVQAG